MFVDWMNGIVYFQFGNLDIMLNSLNKWASPALLTSVLSCQTVYVPRFATSDLRANSRMSVEPEESGPLQDRHKKKVQTAHMGCLLTQV